MSGINEIQARIQEIQHRVAAPAVPGRFRAVLDTQLEQEAPRLDPEMGRKADTESWVVTPQATTASAHGVGSSATQGVTLGVMLGINSNPIFAPRSRTVTRSADLREYLTVNGIEARNGRLDRSDLTPVSGGWNGTGYLLPPAAAGWEEMRSAAAADGIDLRAIDTYRSWDVQEGAYHAHLRGEKAANVLPPGESEHGNGLAVDITNGHLVGVGDPEYTWLRTNASRFGWYPISNESWHWEFRGI
ncbi:MAG: D-alanyl-D-alanine carboxypeptidase family protein [Acidimicrobiia bacterium]|nr:D-alanyl-D-alanine carboxypeptidase family protein [Acidimicrobiia bacterium]